MGLSILGATNTHGTTPAASTPPSPLSQLSAASAPIQPSSSASLLGPLTGGVTPPSWLSDTLATIAAAVNASPTPTPAPTPTQTPSPAPAPAASAPPADPTPVASTPAPASPVPNERTSGQPVATASDDPSLYALFLEARAAIRASNPPLVPPALAPLVTPTQPLPEMRTVSEIVAEISASLVAQASARRDHVLTLIDSSFSGQVGSVQPAAKAPATNQDA
jgi:hypothetical protein